MSEFSARAAARRLNRSDRTVRRWIVAGRVRAVKTAENRFVIPEEEITRLLKETSSTQRSDLEKRLHALEQRLDFVEAKLAQTPTRSKRPPARRLPPSPTDETLIAEADLPPGSVRASAFAEAHGVHAKTLRYHLLVGLGQPKERVDHLAISKPGRPGEVERWLSPEQQRQCLDFWARNDVAVGGN